MATASTSASSRSRSVWPATVLGGRRRLGRVPAPDAHQLDHRRRRPGRWRGPPGPSSRCRPPRTAAPSAGHPGLLVELQPGQPRAGPATSGPRRGRCGAGAGRSPGSRRPRPCRGRRPAGRRAGWWPRSRRSRPMRRSCRTRTARPASRRGRCRPGEGRSRPCLWHPRGSEAFRPDLGRVVAERDQVASDGLDQPGRAAHIGQRALPGPPAHLRQHGRVDAPAVAGQPSGWARSGCG